MQITENANCRTAISSVTYPIKIALSVHPFTRRIVSLPVAKATRKNVDLPYLLLPLGRPVVQLTTMSQTSPAIPRPRIQGLSDLIFGLALSIGSAQTFLNYPKGGYDIVATLVVFGFSFLILINVWLRYTSITSVVPIETVTMVRLNVLLLFLVAIEPYLFYILTKSGLSVDPGLDASSFYALDIAGMNFIIAYFTHLTTIERKKLIPPDMIPRFRLSRTLLLMVGLIFAVSAIPYFGTVTVIGQSLREVLWIATVPIIWITRISTRTAA